MIDDYPSPATSETGGFDAEDLETLAAFVEGALDEKERARVLSRLAEDEAYDELLQELLEITDDDGRLEPDLVIGEEGPDEAPPSPRLAALETGEPSPRPGTPRPDTSESTDRAKVLRGPWPRMIPWITGLAATLLCGLGAFTWFNQANLGEVNRLVTITNSLRLEALTLAVEVLDKAFPGVRAVEAELERVAQVTPPALGPIPRFRNGEQVFSARLAETDFDLGQLAVDLDLAIQSGDLEILRLRADDAVRTLEKAVFPMPDRVEIYGELKAEADRTAPDPDLLWRLHRRAWRLLLNDHPSKFFFLYGSWARSCELRYGRRADKGQAIDEELPAFIERWRDSEEYGIYLEEAAVTLDTKGPHALVELCQRRRARGQLMRREFFE